MNKDFKEFKKYIKEKKVAVVGIGVSNIPLIEFLLKLGAVVTAFDKKSKEELGSVYTDFDSKGVGFSLGKDYLDKLHNFDVVFKTPSMRIDGDALLKVREEGAYITSEMEEFVRYCRGEIFAVTGSDGKTTTTSILYELLKEEGYNAYVGGNIGFPLFSKIEGINAGDKVVLELSSFQLMTMNLPIEVSAITNITPNHLDMHKSMDEYIEAKENIYKYQNKDQLLVLNKENHITYSMRNKVKGSIAFFSSKEEIKDGAYYKDGKLYLKGREVCKKEDVKLLGMHNIENFLAAFLMVSHCVKIETMKKVAKSFNGVAHRNQFLREVDGVRFYNDSIATTPTRTLAGLKVFEKSVIVIAGGYDKKISFDALGKEGGKYIKALILLGDTKEKIKESFEKNIENNNIDIFLVNSLKEAVYKSKEIAKDKDIVTLSPACASFDMYKNFEVRGNEFKKLVNSL